MVDWTPRWWKGISRERSEMKGRRPPRGYLLWLLLVWLARLVAAAGKSTFPPCAKRVKPAFVFIGAERAIISPPTVSWSATITSSPRE